MRSASILRAAVALACCGVAAAASAQQISSGATDNPAISRASCAEVAWEKDLLVQYPRIAEACQEVVVSGGSKWARFTGEFLQLNRDGSVRMTIDDRGGRSMGEFALMPAPDQRALIDGRRVRFADLTRGQQLNLYVPESRFAVATEPGVPPEQTARILPPPPVTEPAPSTQLATAPATAPVTPVVAQVQPAQRLPHTAGPLPWFAVAGMLFLLGGLALGIRRIAAGNRA